VNFQIGALHIGSGSPCLIVAEVGLAHDGSLSQAHAYVDAVAKAGADAVKFQCHLGDTATEWRVPPAWPQDENRQAYWKRTGFTVEQWRGLAGHSADMGLLFMCSPFSVEAVEMLDPLLQVWKVPSGKVTDWALLDAIRDTNKPVLLSTGMGTTLEINDAVRRLGGEKWCRLLQCTSQYPAPPETVGLMLAGYWMGLSDHSGTIYPGIAAAALGCQILEVHVCWSKDQGGFDTAASITIPELGDLVSGVRFVERAMVPVDKDAMSLKLTTARRVFMAQPTITEADIA
jgi:N,N'-diacetyllegionaminate synthase